MKFKFAFSLVFLTVLSICKVTGQHTWTGGANNTTWSNAGNWLGGIPNPGANVTINAAPFQPILEMNTTTIGNLTINPGATLRGFTGLGLSGLTVNGTFVNDGTLTIDNTASIITATFTGDVSGTGSIVLGGGTIGHVINFNGTNNALGGGITVTGNTGTTASARYSRMGNQQVIPTNYKNLIIEGTGIKTLVGSTACNVDVSMTVSNASGGCTFNMGTSAPSLIIKNNLAVNASCVFDFGTGVAKSVTVAQAGGANALTCLGTLNMTGTALAHTLTISGSSPNSCTTLVTTNGSNSSIIYNRTGNQTIFKSMEYQNLSISGTSSKTFQGAGDFRIRGNLTIAASNTLDYGPLPSKSYVMGTATINGSLLTNAAASSDNSLFINGNLSGTGILSLQSTNDSLLLGGANNAIATFSSSFASQTVYYNRAGAQTVFGPPSNYPRLVIGGTGTKTMSATVNCTSLDVKVGATFSMGSATMLNPSGTANIDGVLDDGGTSGKTIFIAGNLSGTGTINLLGSNTLTLEGAGNTIGALNTTPGSGSTVIYQGAINQTVFASGNYENLTLDGTFTKTLAGNSIVNGDINILPGTTFDAANRTLDVHGSFFNYGIFFPGSGLVRFNGTMGGQSVQGGTFASLDISNTSGAVLASTVLTASSTNIMSGATLDLFSATGHNIGTVSGTGVIRVSGSLGTCQVPAPIGSFFASGGGTIDFYGSTAYSIPAFTANHVSFSGIGDKTLSAPSIVNGDLRIASGATLTGVSSSVDLYGNYYQDGTFNAGSSVIRFTNTSLDQSINGAVPPVFSNIEINKSVGKGVYLYTPVSITNGLTFSSGIIELGPHNLVMPSSITISGHGGTNFISTNGTGVLEREISGYSSYDFPVGNGGTYMFASFSFTGGTFSAGTNVSVRAASGEDPNVITTGKSLAPHWVVGSNMLSGPTGQFSFNYADPAIQGNEAAYVGAWYDGTSWMSGAPITMNTAANTFVVPYASTPNINGGYTAGEPTVFSFSNLYSIADADWETPGTWSYSAGGTSCGCIPTASSVVHVTGHTVTKTSATNVSIDTLYIDATGILEIPNAPNSITMNVFTNKGAGGNGRIRIGTTSFPFVTTNDFCNAAGTGLGTVEFYGATYNFYPLTIYPHLHLSGSGVKTAGSANLLVIGNFTVNSNATFNMGGTLTTMTVTGITTVSGGSSFILPAGSPKLVTCLGDFLCSGALNFSGGHTVELRGTNNDIGSLTSSTGTIRYNSASPQNMSTFTNGYYNLEVTGGGAKTLRGPTEVYGNLNMNGAVINLANVDLLLMNPATITGSFSATNSVRVTGTGVFVLNMNGATPTFTRTVPVATSTNYMPITFNLSAFAVSTGEIRIRPVNSVHPNSFAPAISLGGYWDLNSSGISNISGTITCIYQDVQVAGTEGLYVPGYYDGSWTTTGTVTAATNTISFTKTSATTLTGGYTAGQPAAFAAGTITTNNPAQTDYCVNDPISGTFTVTGTYNAGNNFQLELSTSSGAFPGTVINSIASTTPAPINATLPATAGTYKIRVNSTNPVVTGSASATFSVNPAITNNTISASQTFCGPSDPTLLIGTTPVGGNGTYTFQWENSTDGVVFNPIAAATTQNYDPPVISVTTHYRRVVASGGCTNTSTTVVITINPVPAALTLGSNSPVCSGGSILLTANTVAGGTYSWTGPSSYASSLEDPTRASATVAMSGTYSATFTSALGCTSPLATVVVVVNATPAALTLGSNSPVCAGSAINLSANTVAGGTYSWTGPSSFVSALQNPSIGSSTTAMAGTYSATVTVSGCTSPLATVAVVVNPTPAALTLGSNSPVCSGNAINLSANTVAGGTYSWTGPSSFVSALQNPSIGSSTTAMAGTYSATVTVSGCTSPLATVAVVVNATPAALTLGSNSPVCEGNAINLSANTVAGGTYSWTGPSSFVSALQNPSIGSSTAAMAGTYSATVTVSGCTSPLATVGVVVNPVPVFSASNNGPICAGSTLNLMATTVAGGTYAWTGPNAFSSTSQNPSVPSATTVMSGTYSVTVTASGCTSPVMTTPVTVNATPATPTASYNNPVCEGSDINLSSTTAANYNWSGPSGFSSTAQNPVISSSSPLLHSGLYSVTTTVAGCTSLPGNINVVINPVPLTPSITGNTTTCVGQSYIYNVPDNAGSTYSWSVPSGSTIASGNGTHEITVTIGIGSGSVDVTETSAAGCVSPTASLSVFIGNTPAQPSVITGPSQRPCATSTANNYTVVFDVTASSYDWDYSGTGATLTISMNSVDIDFMSATNGTLEVTAINTCGASLPTTLNITLANFPLTPTPISGTLNYCENTMANPFDVGMDTDIDTYTWSYSGSGATINNNGANSITVDFATGATSGNLSVDATNSCGIANASKTLVINSTPAFPGTINGSAALCIPVSGEAYDVTNDPNITSYTWNYTGTGATISGAGNSVLVTFGTGATDGQLEVTASNICGTSGTQTHPIDLTPVPAQPSIIGGNFTPCENTFANSYGVLSDPEATNYIWSYTGTGHTIVGSSNLVNVDFASGATDGNLEVVAQNGCGNSAIRSEPIDIQTVPVIPSAINGPADACTNTSGNVYDVIDDPGATSYVWTYSGTGHTIANGATHSILVDYDAAATGGLLSVAAQNLCGASATSTLSISIGSIPAQPSAITGSNTECENTAGHAYSVTLVSLVNYNWTYSGANTNISNGTTNAPTLDFFTGATSGTLSVTASNSCGTSAASDLLISVLALPLQPSGFTGSASVCDNTFNNPYSVANDPFSTYTWSYTGGGATINGSSSAITIDFAGATNGNLEVFATNMCGDGSVLTTPIVVAPAPGVGLALDAPSDTVCINIDGTVGIIASEMGTTYQAFLGAAPIGTSVTGDGTDKTILLPYNNLLNGANNITIQATNACLVSSMLTNSKTIHRSSHNTSLPVQTSAAASLCVAGTVTYGVTSTAGYTYSWYQGASEIIGYTGSSLDILVPGSYTLKITDNYLCPATSAPFNVVIGVPAPVVSLGATSGTAAEFSSTVPGGANIQWFAVTTNGNKRIQGETAATYTAYYDGQYYVVASMNGCFVPSNLVTLGSMIAGSLERHMLNVDNETIDLPVPDFSKELSLYPNPSAGNFSVNYIRTTDETTIFELYNQQGKLMYSQDITGSGLTTTEVSVPGVTSGLYQIVIREGDKKTQSTIMIQ